ncbi:MAG: iron chaperone [Thiotrichales bacterium]
MKTAAKTIDEYFAALPEARHEALKQLREVLQKNLPEGFAEQMSYGMPGFVVPLSLYPPGYHCTPGTPLPFISYASQKNYIAIYHMGLYADPDLLAWFTAEFPKHSPRKLDMGKSCIRFKNLASIPYQLIGALAQRMTVEDWIGCYEAR